MTSATATAVAETNGSPADEIPYNKQPRDWKKIGVIVGFCAVPIILLVVFTYLPFFQMCGYSFYKMKYIGTPKWVGLKNYIDVFTRPDLLATLKLSLYYMVGAIVQVALALYLATVLAFKVRGGAFFKGAMFFPYLINGIAIGFIFKFFYTRGYVLDTVLQWCGFQLDNLPYWLKDQSINNWSLVFSSVWRYLGQTMILFIGAIMSIDGSLYEAAEIDGANKWQQFKHIILPGIQTILVLNIILSITGSLSAFEAPYVITSGANGTGTFFVQMDKIAHTDQKVGLASAMAVVLLCIIMICALLQKIIMGFLFRDADDGTAKARKHAKKVEKARKKAMRQANRVRPGAAPVFTKRAKRPARANRAVLAAGNVVGNAAGSATVAAAEGK
ncbi:carbohydrate ABC transporter permease [Bifidobacterium choloepi]|uniref:Sugar ABC transporter permease n=1 Tax=Bifidobacterium choloepi TaxID=2614131 RepID=A0A6I5NHT8_9BIFI|nr:sugar ABC transporter permease [Bifidobacterium choloepi]NEG69893.1 sugar ABC transporter permease [Bifidobacterium choloepi]